MNPVSLTELSFQFSVICVVLLAVTVRLEGELGAAGVPPWVAALAILLGAEVPAPLNESTRNA